MKRVYLFYPPAMGSHRRRRPSGGSGSRPNHLRRLMVRVERPGTSCRQQEVLP